MNSKEIKKKKIGILTFHYTSNNFGAVLQAFSMYKLIESLGHESYIIDYIPRLPNLKSKIFNLILKILGFRFAIFRKKYIERILKDCRTENELNELNNLLDAFSVGSDQVWRSRKDTDIVYTYFLNFVNENKKKIAYGASFGIDYWEGDKISTKYISNLLKEYDAISVREKSGVDICKTIFDVDSSLVLDPTLVVDKNIFHELADSYNSSHMQKDYLAYMILDESIESKSFFKSLAKRNKLKFSNIKGTPVVSKRGFYLFNSVEKWLNLIRNAEIIVTDSFHTVVFSVIFHKKFVCLANKNRGITRLQSLLNLIGESSRFYMNNVDIDEKVIFNEINYKEIDEIIEKERKSSVSFLEENFKYI